MDDIIQKFIKSHPQQVAHILDSCSPEELIAFTQQADTHYNDFLPYMSADAIFMLLENLDSINLNQVLCALTDMQLASLIKNIKQDRRATIFAKLPEERIATIHRFLEFSDNQVGYYTQKPKCVMFDHHQVSHALHEFAEINETDLPIFMVNDSYQFLGTLNLVKLIKAHDRPHESLKPMINTKVRAISGSTPLDSLMQEHTWQRSKTIPVIGRKRLLLGVVSIDIMKKRSIEPPQEATKSPVDEYLFFTEMIWAGLNKFWGGLK